MTASRRLATLPLLLIALAVLPWLPRSFRPHAGPLALPPALPSSLRAVRIALLGLALAAVLLWPTTTPAEAQELETVEVWSMTFTVATIPEGLGCREGSSACPTSTLTYDGTDYSIQRVILQADGELHIWTDQFPITTKTLSDLTLRVGSVSLPFADATDNFGVLEWSNSGLSWSVGQSATLRATYTPPPFTPTRVTGFDLHSDNSDPRGMWGNEDTFWVANDGSGTTDKLYAYNRSDGSRDSANDFDNLNSAGNNQPWGICSDGTTMFVGDRTDDKLYAYKMSDTTADSTKDITLNSGNGDSRGMWCDGTTVYVANDGATTANKVFAYTISGGAYDSTKDFEELYLSTNTAAQNAETPRGIWSNGTTMFVADGDDDNVFAYKHSDESQDSAKNLALSGDNDNPRGMWFDGRVLWVVDGTDDTIYAYDLPDGQPDNTPAVGGPVVRSTFTKDVFTAEVTAAEWITSPSRAGYAVAGIVSSLVLGSITETQFTLEGVEYTVRAVLDGNRNTGNGDLILELDRELPSGFTITANGVSYSSSDATESEPGTGRYQYQWSASLSWAASDSIPVVLSVETPKDGEEVSADVSGITDSTDGVASASYQYQWIRVDAADETDIDGETGAAYTPTADDVDKHLKVRVVFDDDAGYKEYPRTSPQFGPVVDAVPPIVSQARAETATTIVVNFSEALDPASVPAASAFAVQVGDTANTVDSVEIGEVIHSFIEFQGVLILTVSTPMLSRDTITLSYTKPDANPLQDPDRNEVASFTDEPTLNQIRETFVSNLGQTVSVTTADLSTNDLAQRFDTGSTASFDFTEVEVLFSTAPGSSATVTAVIAGGLGSADNIVATLTNPNSWSANAIFGIPDGTTLSHNTFYFLIIEATDGVLQTTNSNPEDSGAAANWTIGDAASVRTDETQSGLGGSWTDTTTSASLQMAIRGKHHGRPGTPELAVTAKDQTLVLEVTVPDHGSSNLTDVEARYKETTGGTYTGWTSVSGTISNSGGTFEIGGLDNGTEYTVQVQTVNDIGTSDPSNEDSATPDAPPAITMVAITSDPGMDKTYAIDDDIVVTFTFDKNIELSGMGIPPYIYLYIGPGEEVAPSCAVGTAPTMTMTCTHTVVENDEDTDGIEVDTELVDAGMKIVGPLGQFANLDHDGLAADSDHLVDGVRPTLTGARASADKTKITLTFSEAIGAVDRTKITFDSGGTTLTHTAHSISTTNTSEVEITLTNALGAMDTNVTVALAADAVTDAVGNGNAVLAATPIVDETAPELSETSTPSNTEVLLTYNEPLDADSIPAASAFTVVVNTGGTTRTVSTAALSGTSGILLTLSPAFRPGDVLTVNYTVPALNPIQDIAENEAAALTNQLVGNTLDATAPDMPGSLAANFNLISFLPPLLFNADLMDISWTAPWPNGSPIEKFQYRYAAGPIWSATLTVKDLGSNFLGCDSAETNKACTPGQLLTDNTFSYDSRSYQIETIDLIGGQLKLQATTVFSASALADLTLEVGGLSLPFADATQSLSTLTWTGTGLSWSEDDAVPLSIRSFTAWTDVPDSAPGGANHTSYTVSGLDVDTDYLFEVRAENGIDFGTAASVTKRTRGVLWSFTLRDGSASDVTGLTEGGDSATARVTITNDSRFSTDQTIDLEWGGFSLEDGRIQGAGNTSTITIPAGASTGHLDLSAPDNEANPVYFPLETGDLTATWEDAVIGTIMDLRRTDDESPPVARITDAPLSVNEGDSFDVDIGISVRYPNPEFLKFTITDGDGALSGTLPNQELLIAGTLTATVTLTAAENTTQNDGARQVTFTLETNTDFPYTLGTGEEKTVTIIVRDDDTPPLAVGDLRAQAGNTEATLRWAAPPAPTPDHGQPILHYEYRVKVGTGSFGAWTMVPNSDGTTTSHKFTGLTNETEYTYEVRAENVAGDGAEDDVSVTPRVGVAVSFGAATASITEGGSSAVTVTLDEAPATGTTVVVPITPTRGAGLAASEYSGVPSSVTFNAGDTSKSFTVTVNDDALDEPDETLTLELGILPSGYVPGTNGEIVITVVDDDVPEWEFTLKRGGANVTTLTEGGANAIAVVRITNDVRFEADQLITLKWGDAEIDGGLIQYTSGFLNVAAGASNGSATIHAPQRQGDLYHPPETKTLTAHLGEAQIGDGIELKYVDDEDPPVFTISLRDTRVVEGGTVFLDGTLSRGYDLDTVFLHAFATGATTRIPALGGNLIDGQPNAVWSFSSQSTEAGYGLAPTDNTTSGDHATITFTIPSNPDYYTIGTPSTATLTILDDDTAPGAPSPIAARPGDTEATLSWGSPSNYDQVWISDYQYRVKAGTGSFGSWTIIPDSDGETTGHRFTGLTNDIEYTYEVRGRNSNHNGAAAQVMVTPREGIAVSFDAGSVSITEGGSTTVTVTLGEAPAAGVTVEVLITKTPGAGFGDAEYSGVPASVTFNAGDTSKSFTVSTVDDTNDEPDRLLTLGLGTLQEGYVPGTHATLEVTVADNDLPIVSVSFGKAADSGQEGTEVPVTVRLTQAPEREVVVEITATRGANLGADEHEAVPSSVTFGPGETEQRFTLKFEDDAVVEGNETLTLAFGTLPFRVNSAGENPDLVLTILDDDGPPAAPDVSVRTAGDGFVVLSWEPVVNDSPVLRYEVRWRETDGGAFNAWRSVGLETSYRVEDLTNDEPHTFEVQAVNAHGTANVASVSGRPTERLTGIPTAVQHLSVKATDSGRAELSWGRPSNATDRGTRNSASAPFSQIQGYRIEVCRTTCEGEENWYALVANTGKFEHRYTHQVLAPGVIRENRYRVQAININGKVGPWSNVATLDPTEVRDVYLQTPNDSTLWVRFRVRNPDGNLLYVRYTNTATGTVGHAQYRLTKKQDGVKLVLSGLAADSWYKVELDFNENFDSPRRQAYWYGTAREGETPLTSPYAKDLLDAQVWRGGQWREAPDNEMYLRMGETGKYRVRLKPCGSIYTVIPRRIQAPAGRLRASPTDFEPSLFSNLDCNVVGIGYRTDENGNRLTMSDVYDMTNFQDRANDFIPIYGGSPNDWHEVTVTARALEDYPVETRYDALLSAPFAVVYNHEVYYGSHDTRSGPVSLGTGLVRISLDRPADAVLPVPGGVTIGSDRVMSWDAVPGATGYLVEWRHGPHYSNRANQDRSLRAATSVTLPPGASGRGPVTARVRAYSSSGVSAWSAELTWDSRAPTLNVLDTAVNEADGSVGFLVTLNPAATGIVTVQYTTVDATAVSPADYTATSGTITFAPGETRKQTALVPIVNDGEEDTGETFRLALSSPTGSDANNGAAVLGDAEAVATILNSEREAATLTGFTLVDAGTNADLMALADGSTVRLGELLAASYGIRAETSPGAPPGSVRLALTGARTVTRTDDAAPWSLYGDGAGRVNGQALPVGSYTLRATAYENSGGRGDELGSLEVSFTVAAGVLGVTTPGPFRVAEGETAVAALAASDTGTGETASWSIPAGAEGGADGAAFALTSEGVLSLAAAKDFEAPDDADGDGTYEVTVSVTAGAQTATAALSVTLSDVDEPVLSVTTAGPLTVSEGETAVAALAASDTGTGATASWSIPAGAEGGADGAAFSVTSDGILSLVAAKDFEAPDDADGDGVYEVTVAAAVPASPMAGAQSATAALLVTLSDVNEAPVAQASATAARVRQGARVTLDGSASTDPDAGDTLTYLWTQADDGAPRVTLSDASAEQPAFTSPSDLAAETALAFSLRVTDAAGLHAEDSVTVTVTLISEVSISAASNYAAEGGEAVFRLTRAGSALRALTVPVTVEETGAMLGTSAPADATFAAGERETELRVPTAADAAPETDSLVTVRLASGSGWQLAPGAEAASITVLDDDPAPVTETAAADVTIWSADMTVVEYGPRSIGAGSADLFSNQQGRVGLRAKWLWYDPVERVLRLSFDDGLDDAESLTLHVGDVSLGFPENTGGNSSFSLEGVDLSWTDGETLEARVSKPSASAVSTDATLASLGVEGATLSPAFDAGVVLYWAVADAGAETVSVSARANDDGAAVAYGPPADADAELADHQVAAPTEGDFLVAVTVTAADGTVRRYRVVVAPTATEPNAAPTGAPTISGTPQVGETLTADTSTIADEDGLDDVSYSYQWIRNDNGTESYIVGGASSTYTLDADDVGKTVKVRVTFTDDAGNEETLTSEATEAVAAKPNSEATGLPTITGTPQVAETLTASTSPINDEDGLEDVSYSYQWIRSDGNNDTDIPDATDTTYTLTVDDVGKTIQVRVTFTDDAGNEETLTSEATEAVVAKPNSEATGLPTTTGTPQVDETLTASTSAINDEDGLEDVSYGYQWIRSDGNNDTDIPDATDTTYTLTVDDVGKTIQVRVTFTDDADNEETLTSEATEAVDATVPTQPLSLTVATGDQTQKLDASWQAPSSNGGSGVTGYKVQWKESASSWDTAADVSEATVTGTTETGTTHTIKSLTGGVEYAVRVIATNDVGDSPASTEARATPADSSAAWTATLTVGVSGSGSETVWGYSWFLDGMGTLDGRTYNEGDQTIEVMAILLSNGFVAFNVRPHPGVDFVLTVDGTEFASADASEVKSRTLISYVWATTLDWAEDDRVALSLTLKDTDSAEQSEPAENTPATGLPTITGTPQVDETLTASTSAINDEDGLDNVDYSYQWIGSNGNSDTDIEDASDSTYTPLPSDVGKTIKVKVTFTDDAGNAETLTSEPTETVTAAVPTAPQDLTVSQGSQDQQLEASWQAPSSNGGSAVTGYKVQWKEAADSWDTEADVSEATETGTAHTITGLTGGVEYAVRVIATNDVGDGPASTEVKGTPAGGVSEQAVEPENSAPTGLPGISGTPQVDQSLTADTSPIDDEDGLTEVSYRYQWSAGGSDIEGATGSSYTLTYSEQGQTIQVRVSFTDDRDNAETLTSEATVAVAAAPNREATGKPTVGGAPQVDQTLTADTANIADQDGLTGVSYGYQWVAGGSDIGGATGSTYTLTYSEQGKTIQVRVTFTDDRNNAESLTSVATAEVAAAPEPLTVRLKTAAPATHDGSSEFTFEIEFSEEFNLSYKTLRDFAFTETGGEVHKAQRMDKPSNIRWLITVKPQGNGDVTIELPATTDCDADGAICTGDGRKLSNSLSFTVSGPG